MIVCLVITPVDSTMGLSLGVPDLVLDFIRVGDWDLGDRAVGEGMTPGVWAGDSSIGGVLAILEEAEPSFLESFSFFPVKNNCQSVKKY